MSGGTTVKNEKKHHSKETTAPSGYSWNGFLILVQSLTKIAGCSENKLHRLLGSYISPLANEGRGVAQEEQEERDQCNTHSEPCTKAPALWTSTSPMYKALYRYAPIWRITGIHTEKANALVLNVSRDCSQSICNSCSQCDQCWR